MTVLEEPEAKDDREDINRYYTPSTSGISLNTTLVVLVACSSIIRSKLEYSLRLKAPLLEFKSYYFY